MQRLNGPWVLARDPNNVGRQQSWFNAPRPDAQAAPVPGIIQQVYPDYHGVAWYWCKFVPFTTPQPGMRWQIHFHGFVDYLGEVWLNGQYLGGYEGGEAPFDLDATAVLRSGEENLLAVRVLNPTDDPIDGIVLKETPHRNKVVNYVPGSGFDYGGIMLPVELRAVAAVRVTDVFVRPDPHSGRVPITVTLRNDLDIPAPCRLRVAVGSAMAQGPAVLSWVESMVTAPPGEHQTDIMLQVVQPHLWDLDDPYLYRVTVRCQTTIQGQAVEDEFGVRCGLRDFRVERGYFRLNGRRIFVRSTHTGNHVPGAQVAPVIPDLVRRDLVIAKTAGFNMVRFIVGMAWPEQLDFCDELGLLVYEECMASWCLADSPKMAERFDHQTDAMVRRDRNHPCVAVWGLLNETRDGPVFRHAVDYLPHLRELDDTRLVLLSSGRWDCQWSIGSVSNPGSTTWEHQWGAEASDAAPAPWDGVWKPMSTYPGAYFQGAGDAHMYPETPQSPQTNHFIRMVGHDSKPVFLSEYGIGSLFNVIRETRCFEQARARQDWFDVALIRTWADRLIADWQRWGFDGTYATPEDMLRDSWRLSVRQRLLCFDLVRSNPRYCGYNVTGMLDHGMTGEGLWSFHREWKPGIMDALSDGWAPVRWCLFVEPLHGYVGRRLHVEAVLANEDVLGSNAYAVTYRILGPQGVAWEHQAELCLPEPDGDGDAALAVSALDVQVTLDGPAGVYELRAIMEHGGAPAGGRLKFYLSDAAALPVVRTTITGWGIEPSVVDWLHARGVELRPFTGPAPESREVILVGEPPEAERDLTRWRELARRMASGSSVIFLSPAAFARGEEFVGWLPLPVKGRCYKFHDWLYHKECVAKTGPLFAGLQAGGIMDWDYWGPVIPHYLYEGQPDPAEVNAAAFAVSTTTREGYASGLLLASYGFGAGRMTLNTIPILENLDRHPAADRLLLNLINEAVKQTVEPLTPLPDDFGDLLASIGYTH